MVKTVCHHCQWRVPNARGLCRTCHQIEWVRAMYPAKRKWTPGRKPPTKPAQQATDAYPGSEEKIRVLCERFSNGEQLFHPDDLAVKPTREDWAWGEPSDEPFAVSKIWRRVSGNGSGSA